MIINNNFKVEDIKNIVIIGFHEKVDELIKINDKLKINTEVITRPIKKFSKTHQIQNFRQN